MPAAASILWRLVPGVRPRERQRFLFFALLSGLIGLAQTVGLAGSQALFLARFGVEFLPHTFIAASIVTVVGSLAYASAVGRYHNDRVFIVLLLVGAAALAVLSGATTLGRGWPLPGLICAYYLTLAIFTNHFWTFVGDYFDTLSSKRLFPLFIIGQSLGSMLGGGMAAVVGGVAPTEILIVTWAVFLLAAAALLARSHRRLRRWGPLELEEADETSVEGIRGALRVARRTSIGRWLVLSTLGMVLALFVAQYLYSDVFVRQFPDARELAIFFGVFLFVSNIIEVAVELFLTPFLIRRLGVASANMLHPVLTLLGFVVLAVDYRLYAAILARTNRELLENAMAGPVRNLIYNALPVSVRGQTRAFLEGIVVYSGMVIAGLLLMAGKGIEPLWLCLAGSATAVLYFGANLGVRRQYVHTLVDELRQGRLDLTELGDVLGDREISELAALWQKLLEADDERAVASAAQLAPTLAAHGMLDPLMAGLRQAHAGVRSACVRALGARPESQARDAIRAATHDPDANVRRVAIEALGLDSDEDWADRVALRRRLEDEDARVCAAAAVALDGEGDEFLAAMLQSDSTQTACAALEVLPSERADSALPRITDANSAVRAAALRALARAETPPAFELTGLLESAQHDSSAVRAAAVSVLATRNDAAALNVIAGALTDPIREVRQTAARVLAAQGDTGVEAAAPYLESDAAYEVEAALDVLAGADTERARNLLSNELRTRVRGAWASLLAHRVLPPADSLADRFLQTALSNAMARDWQLAFRVLELTEDPKVMRSVESVLRFASARSRGDALEVLSNLGDRDVAQLFVLLAETGPLEEKLPTVSQHIKPPANADEALAYARSSPDHWLRMAARAVDGDPSEEENMEHLLALRSVPLFVHFSLEQLEALNRVARDVRYLAGDVVVREGAPGGELYIMLGGEVDVIKNHETDQAIHIARLGPGDYFGEMAIFDNQPRSASVVVVEDARLLALGAERLKELVMQTPEIAFQIFSVLTTRIRSVEDRLEEALATTPGPA